MAGTSKVLNELQDENKNYFLANIPKDSVGGVRRLAVLDGSKSSGVRTRLGGIIALCRNSADE